MEKIFVTTDLSGNSKAGIRFALQLAEQINAQLIFYYVSEVTKPTSWSNQHYELYKKENIREKTLKLKNFVNELAGGNKKLMAKASFIVELGLDVDKLIITAAKKNKASFICMSTRGAGKVKKLFGTNASSIITTSSLPVIVVPQKYRVKPIDTLFFACDFASLGKELKIVEDFAAKAKAKTKVYHYDYLLHVAENARKLESKIAKYKTKTVSFQLKRQEIEHSLSYALAEDIKKEKPSILILFTKQNRNWFDRLIMPSEATEMSFHANVPLLTFRKKG